MVSIAAPLPSGVRALYQTPSAVRFVAEVRAGDCSKAGAAP
jgi:hypothetical protein